MPQNNAKPLKPLKWYKELAGPEYRREYGVFLVEGDRAIRQIMVHHAAEITEIVSVSGPSDVYRRYDIRPVSASQFRTISQTRTPQGIMAVVRLPPETYSAGLPEKVGSRILLLEDIQDPGNVGTLIRTAAAFDFDGVVLTEKCADPFSPRCVQATAGGVLSVWLRRSDRYLELVQSLKEKGFTLMAADLEGRAAPPVLNGLKKVVMALGNEAAGLSGPLLSLSDYRVRIPIVRDKAESLNVAACGAILMYLTSVK